MGEKMLIQRFKAICFPEILIYIMFAMVVWDGSVCSADENFPDKSKDIRKLLKVSGIYKQLQYMKQELEKVLSTQVGVTYPRIPKEFWSEFEEIVVSDQEMEVLIDRIVPVYDTNMDHETIRKLIQMFDNPFWEQWKEKMPAISGKAGRLGGDWIREMSEASLIHQRIKYLAEKYDLENLNKK
tara:strand:+ start:824 stop:1372 length:549 start_codon:yes stop_codon:yes gene_type:complete